MISNEPVDRSGLLGPHAHAHDAARTPSDAKKNNPRHLCEDSFAGRVAGLERLAEIQLTSESAAHPIEAALLPGHGDGWRASVPDYKQFRSFSTIRNRYGRSTSSSWRSGKHARRNSFCAGLESRTAPSKRLCANNITSFRRGARWRTGGVLELHIVPRIEGGGTASITEWRIR